MSNRKTYHDHNNKTNHNNNNKTNHNHNNKTNHSNGDRVRKGRRWGQRGLEKRLCLEPQVFLILFYSILLLFICNRTTKLETHLTHLEWLLLSCLLPNTTRHQRDQQEQCPGALKKAQEMLTRQLSCLFVSSLSIAQECNIMTCYLIWSVFGEH